MWQSTVDIVVHTDLRRWCASFQSEHGSVVEWDPVSVTPFLKRFVPLYHVRSKTFHQYAIFIIGESAILLVRPPVGPLTLLALFVFSHR